MTNAVLPYKRGGHKYDEEGTSDCKLGCGCYMGPFTSGSRRDGVDPFGKCPNNDYKPVSRPKLPSVTITCEEYTKLLADSEELRIIKLARKI